MKKVSFYSKTSIFIYSILLTGVIGALMLGHNLRKAGKNKIVFPLVLITLLTNVLLRLIIKSIRPQLGRTWNLNKTIGWDWDITNFVWWVGDLYQFFLPNIIIGFVLVSYVWNKQLSGFQTDEHKRPWMPFVLTILFYAGFLITLFIITRGE